MHDRLLEEEKIEDDERWKTIKEFKKYDISTKGRCRIKKTGKILKPIANTNGYMKYHLTNKKGGRAKSRYVSRLVAIAFIKNVDNLPTVDHIDHDIKNNTVENLRWASGGQQNQNKGKTKRGGKSSSIYKGVCKDGVRFRVAVTLDGERKFLGRFTNEEEAAKVYDMEAIELFGQFAKTNFPISNYLKPVEEQNEKKKKKKKYSDDQINIFKESAKQKKLFKEHFSKYAFIDD